MDVNALGVSFQFPPCNPSLDLTGASQAASNIEVATKQLPDSQSLVFGEETEKIRWDQKLSEELLKKSLSYTTSFNDDVKATVGVKAYDAHVTLIRENGDEGDDDANTPIEKADNIKASVVGKKTDDIKSSEIGEKAVDVFILVADEKADDDAYATLGGERADDPNSTVEVEKADDAKASVRGEKEHDINATTVDEDADAAHATVEVGKADGAYTTVVGENVCCAKAIFGIEKADNMNATIIEGKVYDTYPTLEIGKGDDLNTIVVGEKADNVKSTVISKILDKTKLDIEKASVVKKADDANTIVVSKKTDDEFATLLGGKADEANVTVVCEKADVNTIMISEKVDDFDALAVGVKDDASHCKKFVFTILILVSSMACVAAFQEQEMCTVEVPKGLVEIFVSSYEEREIFNFGFDGVAIGNVDTFFNGPVMLNDTFEKTFNISLTPSKQWSIFSIIHFNVSQAIVTISSEASALKEWLINGKNYPSCKLDPAKLTVLLKATDSKLHDSGFPEGAIAAIVLAIIVFIGLAVFLGWWFIIKKADHHSNDAMPEPDQESHPGDTSQQHPVSGENQGSNGAVQYNPNGDAQSSTMEAAFPLLNNVNGIELNVSTGT